METGQVCAVVWARGVDGTDRAVAGKMKTFGYLGSRSYDFLMGWMSKVRKREESRATFRFLGNWVDLLSWKRWGWGSGEQV